MRAPSSRSAASLINPFLAQRYSVLLEFPVSGVVDAQPFSCPSLGISSSRCMFNTDARIFTNALITARPETGVPLTYSTSPCGKGLFRDRDGILLAQFSCNGLDLPTLLRAIRRFAVSGQKRRVRCCLPGPHRLSRLLRASAGTRIADRENRCWV
jgi:hypothetical protein